PLTKAEPMHIGSTNDLGLSRVTSGTNSSWCSATDFDVARIHIRQAGRVANCGCRKVDIVLHAVKCHRSFSLPPDLEHGPTSSGIAVLRFADAADIDEAHTRDVARPRFVGVAKYEHITIG